MFDTRTSPAFALAAIRAAMWTAIPPMSSPRRTHSPVCSPLTNVEADLRYALGNRGGAQNGPGWAVECRQYPVAGVFDEPTLERTDLGTRHLIVAL